MALRQTHKGWENEHLATFLLSRISFVSKPITIGDDIGIDLIATLFDDAISTKNRKILVPRTAIAIQVKSNRRKIDITKRSKYFGRLELPLFIGVVSQPKQSLALYSCRYLPAMLSYRGNPSKLELKPVDTLESNYKLGDEKAGFTILCPHTETLSVSDPSEILAKKRQTLQKEAKISLNAIVSRLNNEFIFEKPDGSLEIFTGDDSANTFRENFYMRLAEAIANLIHLQEESKPVGDEAALYLKIYDLLSESIEVPDYLVKRADRLRNASP